MTAVLFGCGDDDGREINEPGTTPTATVTATPVLPTVTPPTPTATSNATDTPTPTPTSTALPIEIADFVGAYAALADGTGRLVPEQWIATVRGTNELARINIHFDGHSVVGLEGVLGPDGTIDLTGSGVFEDDIVVFAEGTATFEQTGDIQRIRGAFDTMPLDFFSRTFRLERRISPRPSRFAGAYRFTLEPSPSRCECTTTATIVIETDDDGIGRSVVEASELDEQGTQRGTFDPGDCLVTESGQLRCALPYQPSVVGAHSFFVTLTGQLNASGDSVTGSGVSSAQIFPVPFFLGGTWTAIR